MEHWADYLIFVGVLLISIGIGVYHAFTGGKQRTNEEFIMADRKLKWLPTGISLLVSYSSVVTIVGAPAELYTYGLAAWPALIITGGLACILISRVFVPWLYPLRLTSINGYIWMRYESRFIQMTGTSLSLIQCVTYAAMTIVAPSLAMETASGLSPSITIPVITIVCTIYTTLGGMKAVIWTDVFQFLIMTTGLCTVFGKAVILSGGLGQTFDSLAKTGRASLSISADPTTRHTLWGFLFGWVIYATGFLGFQQSTIQRCSAVPSLDHAKRIPYVFFLGFVVMYSLCFLTGCAIFGYYHRLDCDPIISGQAQSPNQILSLFTTTTFRGTPGFSGLFMASLFSATLSSVSSLLSGSAAITWDDILKHRLRNITEERAAACSKILVVIYGVVVLGLAFGVANIGGPILQVAMSLSALCLGPFTGIFFCAGCRFLRWVGWQCVAVGSVVGFGIGLWMQIGAAILKPPLYPHPPPLATIGCNSTYNHTTATPTNYTERHGLERIYLLSYVWKMPLGFICTVVVAILLSLLARIYNRVCMNTEIPDTGDAVNGEMFIKWKTLFCCTKTNYRGTKEPRERADVTMQLVPGYPQHATDVRNSPDSVKEC